jgi:D-glycero-D-manno-heptose 1,7-bisphosphate phosphatase
MRRALFVDRDGVLDELVFYPSHGEWEGPRTVGDLRMIAGAAAALRRAQDAGWLLFIVTNQPSFAKGKTTLEALVEVHERVLAELAREGVQIAESYRCYHQADDRCHCRKPSPFFLRKAARDFQVALDRSWMIGDQDTDMGSGRAAGCRIALIENPSSAHKRGAIEPDARYATLSEAIDDIVGREQEQTAT